MDRAEDKLAVILSDNYHREHDDLINDPIIIQMASELPPDWKLVMCESDHGILTPKWHFTQQCNNEYTRRGGRNSKTIGAVAYAIIAVREENPKVEPLKDANGRYYNEGDLVRQITGRPVHWGRQGTVIELSQRQVKVAIGATGQQCFNPEELVIYATFDKKLGYHVDVLEGGRTFA